MECIYTALPRSFMYRMVHSAGKTSRGFKTVRSCRVPASIPYISATSLYRGRFQSRSRFTLSNIQVSTRFINKLSSSHAGAVVSPTNESESDVPGEITSRQFEEMPIDHRLKKALLEDFGYSTATSVQQMTLKPCLSGEDLLVRAKTGTGKTLGFLIPIIHQHFRDAVKAARHKPRRVPVLIIAPTRELAKQAEKEATKLLSYMPRELVAQSCIGGTARGISMKRLERVPPFILAATPGRLLDMIKTCGWDSIFDDLRVLVLDEADRLLDMGFRQEIDQILQHLNDRQQKRQTLLFSATYPPDVQRVANLACLQPARIIHVAEEANDGSTAEAETASTVTQRVTQAPLADILPSLHAMIHQHIATRSSQRLPAKIMVFFPTALQAKFFSTVYERDTYNLYSLHSRMQQSKRDRISGTFRSVKEGVLFTTDVSARGIDYPGVSLVIQVGIPSSREQYVHRVGRTGRGGREGEAVLLISPEEEHFAMNELLGLPVTPTNLTDILAGPTDKHDAVTAEEAVNNLLSAGRDFVSRRFEKLRVYDNEVGSDTYMSFLGHYRSLTGPMGMRPQDLINFANQYATKALMLAEPPALSSNVLEKMGLRDKRLDGLRSRSSHSRRFPPQYSSPSRARKPRPPTRY
eukprot:gene7908-698_t